MRQIIQNRVSLQLPDLKEQSPTLQIDNRDQQINTRPGTILILFEN